ncbi:hypothetical protein FOXB_10079 [Fusarium oxysporum f. sp. conglutinans Fo5176]|uniref:Uncharacterized protein n=1 Tax=Fusarium oxysporum (strain Fo5176) TaxID=660025 RepID=F9FUJ8_FUSOF|nr:hypothetical protein FOXB_10079 [Fusarium oxysporum f. sp. conglutinans Fo5176]
MYIAHRIGVYGACVIRQVETGRASTIEPVADGAKFNEAIDNAMR